MSEKEKLWELLKTEVEKESPEISSPLKLTMEDIYENVRTDSACSSVQERDELRIMLLGARGSGKSSTGNTILRSQAFNTDMQLSRVTRTCERASALVLGRAVSVIDTPGLVHIKRMEQEVTREILSSASLCRPGPHVFLLVLPVGNLTNEDKGMQKLIQKLFGRGVWTFTVLVFTHGDRLEGRTPNHVISSSDADLRDFIRSCSGGFVFFNNKDAENVEQVSRLLQKVDTLVALNAGGCYTTALYPASERKLRLKQEQILERRRKQIALRERKLEEECEERQELERRRRDLWMEEELEARMLAEKQRSASLSLASSSVSLSKHHGIH